MQGLYIFIEQNYNTETVVQCLQIYEFFKMWSLRTKYLAKLSFKCKSKTHAYQIFHSTKNHETLEEQYDLAKQYKQSKCEGDNCLKGNCLKATKVMIPLGFSIFNALLIAIQPDLGTTIIYMGIVFMIFLNLPINRNIKRNSIIGIIGIIAISLLFLYSFNSSLVSIIKLSILEVLAFKLLSTFSLVLFIRLSISFFTFSIASSLKFSASILEFSLSILVCSWSSIFESLSNNWKNEISIQKQL